MLTADDLARAAAAHLRAGPAGRRRSSARSPTRGRWPWRRAGRTYASTACVHATFWVAEWPRTEVRSDFLAPLLLGSARVDPLGRDGAPRPRHGGAQGRGLPDRRPGRCRAAPARRLRLDGAPRPGVRGPGPSGGRAGRGSRLVPLLGLRHRLGRGRGGAGGGLRRRAARGGAEQDRLAPPLRRPGRRPTPAPSRSAAGCAERVATAGPPADPRGPPTMAPWPTAPTRPARDGSMWMVRRPTPRGGRGAGEQLQRHGIA